MTTTTEQPTAIQTTSPTQQARSQRSDQPNWSEFWPAEPDTDADSDAFVREVLTGLEDRSVQERLAGYKSETQGQ